MRRLAFALCVLAACGDDGGNNNKMDGGVTPDILDIDAPPVETPVKITVSSNGTKIPGVRVHFQNPDSTLVASADTDANGEASAIMPLGGYVTAIAPFPNAPNGLGTAVELRTFAGVKAGDELVLTQSGGDLDTAVTVTGPIDADAAVTDYIFLSPCDTEQTAKPTDASNPTVQLGLSGDCLTSTDIVIVSLDANEEIVHWLYAANVTPTSNAIDLSAMTLATAGTLKSYTFNNIPAAIGGLQLGQQLASSKGVVVDRGEEELVGTTATHSWKLPAFTNAVDLAIAMMPMESHQGEHALVDWGPFSATYTTDVGARLLIEPTTPASFDPTTHQVQWTPATTGVTPDFSMAFVRASRATESLQIAWQLSGPYDAGVLQFPTLPVENGDDYNFAATDTTGVDLILIGKVTGGYDAVRGIIQDLEGPQAIIGTSPTGSMEFEQFSDEVVVNARRAGSISRGKFLQKAVSPTWKFRRRM